MSKKEIQNRSLIEKTIRLFLVWLMGIVEAFFIVAFGQAFSMYFFDAKTREPIQFILWLFIFLGIGLATRYVFRHFKPNKSSEEDPIE